MFEFEYKRKNHEQMLGKSILETGIDFKFVNIMI
jgi:hypothetical protein